MYSGEKVSFRPGTGPEFPSNDKNPKPFDTVVLPLEVSDIKMIKKIAFWDNLSLVSWCKLTFCDPYSSIQYLCIFK